MSVAENLIRVKERIATAASRAGRPTDSVRLVGATKTVEPERIEMAMAAGLEIAGENYIQEARDKIARLGRRLTWHFIGHLQTNKAKYAVKLFDLIETVDSLKLARELNRRAEPLGRRLPVLIQVNLAGEASKSGVPPGDALGLIRAISGLPCLQVLGLMTMPPLFNEPERARPYFRRLRELSEEIAAEAIPGVQMSELSMGMSGDFEVAIEEGATLVRVGTAIFGARP